MIEQTGEEIYKALIGEGGSGKAAPAQTGEEIYQQLIARADKTPKQSPPELSIDPITGFPVGGNGQPIAGAGTTLAGQDQGTVIANQPRSLDEARASVESMPSGYFGVIPAVRSLGLGALDVLQGRVGVQGGGVDEPAPSVFSLRPTPDTTNLLSLYAGRSPGMGTGRAIAETAETGAPARELFAPRSRDDIKIMAPPDRSGLTAPTNAPAVTVPPQAMPLTALDPAYQVPQPGAEPVPQSVGAAASRDTANPNAIPPETPEQKLTNLEKSVNQTAEDRAGPQMQDHTTYVDGVERTHAAREFSPTNSVDDKTMRATDQAYRASQEKIEREANQIMLDKLRNDALDQNAVKAAHEDREAVAPPAQQLFEGEKPVDAAPLVKRIDDLLAGPDGKREAVVSTLTKIRKSLHDAEGNLEEMPSQLYGARKNITDLLKKGTGNAADDVRASKPILMDLLDRLDPIINDGAPKFQAFLDDFHQASQPINQMEFLQKYQTGAKKLTDADGYLQFNKVQKMLDDIYQGRKAPGINLAKSLTDEQIQNVINVRNELAANHLRDRLGRVKGSDTMQQTNRAGILGDGPLGTAIKGGAEMALHAGIAASPLAGWGNAGLGVYKAVVKPAREAAKARTEANVLAARKAQLLSTRPSPLTPP